MRMEHQGGRANLEEARGGVPSRALGEFPAALSLLDTKLLEILWPEVV